MGKKTKKKGRQFFHLSPGSAPYQLMFEGEVADEENGPSKPRPPAKPTVQSSARDLVRPVKQTQQKRPRPLPVPVPVPVLCWVWVETAISDRQTSLTSLHHRPPPSRHHQPPLSGRLMEQTRASP